MNKRMERKARKDRKKKELWEFSAGFARFALIRRVFLQFSSGGRNL